MARYFFVPSPPPSLSSLFHPLPFWLAGHFGRLSVVAKQGGRGRERKKEFCQRGGGKVPLFQLQPPISFSDGRRRGRMNILGGGGEGRGVEGARKARDKEQQVGRGEGGGRGRKEERRGI